MPIRLILQHHGVTGDEGWTKRPHLVLYQVALTEIPEALHEKPDSILVVEVNLSHEQYGMLTVFAGKIISIAMMRFCSAK